MAVHRSDSNLPCTRRHPHLTSEAHRIAFGYGRQSPYRQARPLIVSAPRAARCPVSSRARSGALGHDARGGRTTPSTSRRGGDRPSVSICRAVASRAVQQQEQIIRPGGGLPGIVVPAPELNKRKPVACSPRSRGVAGSGGGAHGWSTASATGAPEDKAVPTCERPLPQGSGTPRSLSLPRKGVVSRLPPSTRRGQAGLRASCSGLRWFPV